MDDHKQAVADQFAQNLKYLRRRVRLSQEQLAIRASVHRTAVGMWENGERIPRIDSLIKLAGALEASVDELLDSIIWMPGGSIDGMY